MVAKEEIACLIEIAYCYQLQHTLQRYAFHFVAYGENSGLRVLIHQCGVQAARCVCMFENNQREFLAIWPSQNRPPDSRTPLPLAPNDATIRSDLLVQEGVQQTAGADHGR